jgi:hypothetical protein
MNVIVKRFSISAGTCTAANFENKREEEDGKTEKAKMNASVKRAMSISAGTPQVVNLDKKREDEDGKKERKVIKMVIINGILNFVLRAPDLLFWLENKMTWSIFKTKDDNNDYILNNILPPGILSVIADIDYLTYILTFSTNFLIYYNFNKNFKDAVFFFRTSTKPKSFLTK